MWSSPACSLRHPKPRLTPALALCRHVKLREGVAVLLSAVLRWLHAAQKGFRDLQETRRSEAEPRFISTRQRPSPCRCSAGRNKAARRKARATGGEALLPAAYQHNRIKQQAGTRFEAFDFSAHNKTRYAGLENDMANSYANPLWQILYFIPALR